MNRSTDYDISRLAQTFEQPESDDTTYYFTEAGIIVFARTIRAQAIEEAAAEILKNPNDWAPSEAKLKLAARIRALKIEL